MLAGKPPTVYDDGQQSRNSLPLISEFEGLHCAFSRHEFLGANGSSHDSSALPLQGICARRRGFPDEFFAFLAGYFCRSHCAFSDFIRADPKVRSTGSRPGFDGGHATLAGLATSCRCPAGLGCGIEHGDDPLNRWCRAQPVSPRHPWTPR